MPPRPPLSARLKRTRNPQSNRIMRNAAQIESDRRAARAELEDERRMHNTTIRSRKCTCLLQQPFMPVVGFVKRQVVLRGFSPVEMGKAERGRDVEAAAVRFRAEESGRQKTKPQGLQFSPRLRAQPNQSTQPDRQAWPDRAQAATMRVHIGDSRGKNIYKRQHCQETQDLSAVKLK